MQITWYGHSAFRLDFGGRAVLIDPFFTGNPSFDGDVSAIEKGVSHILVTHGHGDHVGDTVDIARRTGATVVTNYDLCMHLASQGVEKFEPMNTGGTIETDGFRVSLVRADHSAAMIEAGVDRPLGNPNGIIVQAPGEPTVYAMGDTAIFSDMALINELYAPDIAFVPIGDRFTMGPDHAAYAVRKFFTLKAVVPCHYATFPLLVQDAQKFADALQGSSTRVIVPKKNEPFTV
ncbi:metal-dependent hydrolase [Camelimonas abortus]|uniref:UPF0173 metal-dependent hydrolase ACFOEX_07130 n=1 Tax=Camelimonas abortus TaxID=1017184 RepID=A0ABV7LEB1_9HYPH